MNGSEILTRLPAVQFLTTGVPPPAPLYIGPGDDLWVTIQSSVAGGVVPIVGRMLSPEGEVLLFQQIITTMGGRTHYEYGFPLAEGFLLSIVVGNVISAIRRGQVWVHVALRRGATSLLLPVHHLISGYATTCDRLCWPGGTIASSLDGRGDLENMNMGSPAAGTDWTYQVPTYWSLRPLSIRGMLVTDGTVASRLVYLILDDGSNVYYEVPAFTMQTASQSFVYHWAPGLPLIAAVSTHIMCPIPIGLRLFPGWRIRSVTAAIQAGDQWSGLYIMGEFWLQD